MRESCNGSQQESQKLTDGRPEATPRTEEPVYRFNVKTVDHRDGRAPYGAMVDDKDGRWMSYNQHVAILSQAKAEIEALRREKADLNQRDDITMTAFSKLETTCKALADQRDEALSQLSHLSKELEEARNLLRECKGTLRTDQHDGHRRLAVAIDSALHHDREGK